MFQIQKAVLQKDGKYLILLRSAHAIHFPKHWDFPGGNLEEGEEPFAGIAREVKEETCLDVTPMEVVGVYEFDLNHAGQPTHRFTLYTTCIMSGEVLLSDEHTEYRWATKDDIFALNNIEPYIRPYFTGRD